MAQDLPVGINNNNKLQAVHLCFCRVVCSAFRHTSRTFTANIDARSAYFGETMSAKKAAVAPIVVQVKQWRSIIALHEDEVIGIREGGKEEGEGCDVGVGEGVRTKGKGLCLGCVWGDVTSSAVACRL